MSAGQEGKMGRSARKLPAPKLFATSGLPTSVSFHYLPGKKQPCKHVQCSEPAWILTNSRWWVQSKGFPSNHINLYFLPLTAHSSYLIALHLCRACLKNTTASISLTHLPASVDRLQSWMLFLSRLSPLWDLQLLTSVCDQSPKWLRGRGGGGGSIEEGYRTVEFCMFNTYSGDSSGADRWVPSWWCTWRNGEVAMLSWSCPFLFQKHTEQLQDRALESLFLLACDLYKASDFSEVWS